MKFSVALLASCTTFLPRVTANFDVYLTDINGVYKGWQVFPSEATCDEAWVNEVWEWEGDVSGDKVGFRCKGDGCDWSTSPSEIEELEMNFHEKSPKYHWTIYKNRGRVLTGTDDVSYGDCIVFPHGDFDCWSAGVTRKGARKFRCLTQFTADQLNAVA